MTINQLRYFIAIGQLENISRVAEFFDINQPALSKNISKLEKEIGSPLFDRNGKHLSLNAQGKRFMECAAIVLRELEIAEADIRKIDDSKSRALHIGVAGCSKEILDCVSEFRAKHPECEIEFDFSIEGAESLDINDYDILVYPDDIRYEKYRGYGWGVERYYLAAPATHPLSDCSVISIEQLADLDYVFIKQGKLFFEFPYRVCTALHIPFHSVCYADTRQSQLQIISAGMAVGLIPDSMAYEVADAKVRFIPLDSKRFSRRMKICFMHDKHLTPLAREFKEMILQRLPAGQKEAALAHTVDENLPVERAAEESLLR